MGIGAVTILHFYIMVKMTNIKFGNNSVGDCRKVSGKRKVGLFQEKEEKVGLYLFHLLENSNCTGKQSKKRLAIAGKKNQKKKKKQNECALVVIKKHTVVAHDPSREQQKEQWYPPTPSRLCPSRSPLLRMRATTTSALATFSRLRGPTRRRSRCVHVFLTVVRHV